MSIPASFLQFNFIVPQFYLKCVFPSRVMQDMLKIFVLLDICKLRGISV